MEHLALLAALVVFVLVAVHQWVLDSPLFELGTASWFPAGGDLSTAAALGRSALSAAVPLVATAVAAALVLFAPFDVWVWSLVALLAATVVLSPLLSVFRYDVRPPTPAERAALSATPDLGCAVVVVTDATDGPVNGYAIGGPFRDVVGVSAFALVHLPPAQVAALVAHEAAHHHERHVLVRGGASVAVLATGALVATLAFDALVPAATLVLVATVAVERVVAGWVMRHTEYRADAAAARDTSTEAMVSLLAALDRATPVDQSRVPLSQRLLSTHPSYADRVARLRAVADGDRARGAGQTPDSATPR